MVTDSDADDSGPVAGDDLEPHDLDGETVYVARREVERGSKGPFHVVYVTPDRDRRYGWFCGNCQGFDAAMDTMGRVECNACGNYRKPTEWDAAHE